jgi:hypothetical protein
VLPGDEEFEVSSVMEREDIFVPRVEVSGSGPMAWGNVALGSVIQLFVSNFDDLQGAVQWAIVDKVRFPPTRKESDELHQIKSTKRHTTKVVSE